MRAPAGGRAAVFRCYYTTKVRFYARVLPRLYPKRNKRRGILSEKTRLILLSRQINCANACKNN